MILDAINELIEFEGLFFHYDLVDKIYYRNLILEELNISNPKVFECDDLENVEGLRLPDPILEEIKEYIVNDMKLSEQQADRKICKILGLITPPNSYVVEKFEQLEKTDPYIALKYLYDLSIRNYYIQKSKVEKNIVWTSNFDKKNIEISINLSKPEKNVKDIAKLASKKASFEQDENYPKCQLCLENVGYIGDDKKPSKVNLRVVPLTLGGEEWFLQYSPYGYFEKHCIAFSRHHNNMIINISTFEKLADFVDRFPQFFIGSNADLPVVGGSILSHEHFQGGEHVFPAMKAEAKKEFELHGFKNSHLYLLDWYNTILLIQSTNREEMIKIASKILLKWKDYDDEDNDIIAHDKDGEHNTITPVIKKIHDTYHLFLILRNNRTTYKYPDGIFHAHEKYYHIKKENIGIIEAMGLFILPARLKRQLELVKNVLKEGLTNEEIYKKYPELADFSLMFSELRKIYNEKTIDEDIKTYVNNVCRNILINTAVFKETERGEYGINEFIKGCNL